MEHSNEEFLKKFKSIILYFFFSLISTVVDAAIVWILYSAMGWNLRLSNSIGVAVGFLISFVLSVKV